jgi:YegS/Rv2252/BmrU family lipid kinase
VREPDASTKSAWWKSQVRDLERERSDLPDLQVQVVFETTREMVVKRAMGAALEGYDSVIAAGGDGTVNAVVNGLMQAHEQWLRAPVSKDKGPTLPALGILPMGTGNVFAFNMGIARELREACRVIRRGQTRAVDVGVARTAVPPFESRHFLLMAGVGFDAKVVEDTSLRLKYVLRDFAYVLKILQNGISHRGAKTRLKFVEGVEYSGDSWLVMIGNAAAYAWDIRFTSHAHLDDGLVDVCLFPFENKVASVRQVLQVLTGQHIERGTVKYWKTAGLQIESEPPAPVQLDGDEWSRTPIHIAVQPAALRVLAPCHDIVE